MLLRKSLLKVIVIAATVFSIAIPTKTAAQPTYLGFKHAVIIATSLLSIGVGAAVVTKEPLNVKERIANTVCGSIILGMGVVSFLFSELILDMVTILSEECIKMLQEARK